MEFNDPSYYNLMEFNGDTSTDNKLHYTPSTGDIVLISGTGLAVVLMIFIALETYLRHRPSNQEAVDTVPASVLEYRSNGDRPSVAGLVIGLIADAGTIVANGIFLIVKLLLQGVSI